MAVAAEHLSAGPDAGGRRELRLVAPPAPKSWRLTLVAVYFTTLAIYATSPVVTNGDSYLTVPTAHSILHEGDLDIDEFHSPPVTEHYGLTARRGHRFDFFPWTVSLFAIPVVAVIDGAEAVGIGPGAASLIRNDRMGPMQLAASAPIVAGSVVVVAAVARFVLGGDETRRRRLALLTAAGFAFGTASWSVASRALWQHAPSLLLVALATLLAARLAAQRRGHRAAAVALGAAAAAAYAIRPTNALLLVALLVWLAASHRMALTWFVLGGSVVGAAFLAVNMTVFGTWLPPYHDGSRLAWHADLPQAVAANLVSPARGLLVFSPLTVLALVGLGARLRRRDLPGLDLACAAVVVAHLVAVSAFRGTWWGGHTFGSRFTIDVLPLLVFLALPAIDRLGSLAGGRRRHTRRLVALGLVGTAALWSVAVHAQGAYLRSTACWNGAPANVDEEPRRVWDWSDPQVVAGMRALAEGPVHQAVLGPCPERRRS